MRSNRHEQGKRGQSGGALKTALALLLTLGSSGFFSGCDYRVEKARAGEPRPGQTSLGAPGFQTIFDSVLGPRCVACHGSAGGVNLETYQNVSANLGLIDAVIRARTMPPNNPLPAEEEALLLNWIAAGAPEQATSGVPEPSTPAPEPATPTPPPEPTTPTPAPTAAPGPAMLEPTYTSIRANIFVPLCLQCHAAGRSASFLRLDNLSSFASSGVINRTNPAQSVLITIVKRTDSRRMPPPSSGLRHLTNEEIDVMTQWIQLGLPE